MNENSPKPGSKEAVEQGCTCPVRDNRNGKGVFGARDGVDFWINENCQLHNTERDDGRKTI